VRHGTCGLAGHNGERLLPVIAVTFVIRIIQYAQLNVSILQRWISTENRFLQFLCTLCLSVGLFTRVTDNRRTLEGLK